MKKLKLAYIELTNGDRYLVKFKDGFTGLASRETAEKALLCAKDKWVKRSIFKI